MTDIRIRIRRAMAREKAVVILNVIEDYLGKKLASSKYTYLKRRIIQILSGM